MRVIRGRNTCQNYAAAIKMLFMEGVKTDSRAGEVLVLDCPVMTVTERPRERVIFDSARDANPFFHLFECLWMLSGSNDATWLDKFVSDFSSRFAEEDGVQWGAYGHRWVHHFDINQIERSIILLTENPLDRRVVIGMWDPSYDLGVSVSDVPCNTHIYPRIVNGALDLTVCCRSNDIVWGAYGSNSVHFSFLQEYMAGRIGCEVGTLYQLSNNWHGYTDVIHNRFVGEAVDLYQNMLMRVSPAPIGNDWDQWDTDLENFMKQDGSEYSNVWFRHTAQVLWDAHGLWKAGLKGDARAKVEECFSSDWRLATLQWMDRRS